MESRDALLGGLRLRGALANSATPLAGLPGISIPAGLNSEGLPLGLQLIGRPWEEGDLMNIAYTLETATEFSKKPEKWW